MSEINILEFQWPPNILAGKRHSILTCFSSCPPWKISCFILSTIKNSGGEDITKDAEVSTEKEATRIFCILVQFGGNFLPFRQ